jgi:hypothetical protein
MECSRFTNTGSSVNGLAVIVRSLAWLLVLTTFAPPSRAEAQGARRPVPAAFTRDTVVQRLARDSTPTGRLRLLRNPAAQDSTTECQSSYPYVLLGGLVGAIIGSARHEEASENDTGFNIPLLSIPLIMGPYILGGMLLGYLLAPC